MKIRTIVFVFLFSLTSWCCDNCSVYLNINPNDNAHSVGIYYRYRLMMGAYSLGGQQMLTKHTGHGSNQSFWGKQVREQFNTYELRGKIQIGNRFRTYLIIPFIHNTQEIGQEEKMSISGLGDPTVIGSFQLINPTKPFSNEDLRVRVEIGAGFKSPLGKIDKMVGEASPNLDLQPGSGGFDGLFMLRHNLKYKRFGYMSMINFKLNGRNRDGYKYGNIINGTFSLFHQTELGKFTLMPVIGANFEYAFFDESIMKHDDTGGSAIFLNCAMHLYRNKLQFFAEFQKAVSNKMNGYTQLINKHKVNIGLIYNF